MNWIPTKAKTMRDKNGKFIKYIFYFKCPNCNSKFSYFWRETGLHADSGIHQCKKCKRSFSFICDWSLLSD